MDYEILTERSELDVPTHHAHEIIQQCWKVRNEDWIQCPRQLRLPVSFIPSRITEDNEHVFALESMERRKIDVYRPHMETIGDQDQTVIRHIQALQETGERSEWVEVSYAVNCILEIMCM
jgi:hypothetical protein